MLYDDFHNFKSLAKETNSQKVPWRNICWLQYRKSNPLKIFYKTNYNDKAFSDFNIKKKRGRPRQRYFLPSAYGEKLSISEAKLKDLKKMCAELIIPKEHLSFYESLEASQVIRDKLPEPDAEEDDSEYE